MEFNPPPFPTCTDQKLRTPGTGRAVRIVGERRGRHLRLSDVGMDEKGSALPLTSNVLGWIPGRCWCGVGLGSQCIGMAPSTESGDSRARGLCSDPYQEPLSPQSFMEWEQKRNTPAVITAEGLSHWQKHPSSSRKVSSLRSEGKLHIPTEASGDTGDRREPRRTPCSWRVCKPPGAWTQPQISWLDWDFVIQMA